MLIKLKVNNNGVNESYYDKLNDLLTEYQDLESTCEHLVSFSTPSEMNRYIRILLENIKDLQHYRDTTTGLFATDNLEFISEHKEVLFELEDSKYITQAD